MKAFFAAVLIFIKSLLGFNADSSEFKTVDLSPSPNVVEEVIVSPSPEPSAILQHSPTLLINCVGPDGISFKTTQKECDYFNNAWKPSPTTQLSLENSSEPWHNVLNFSGTRSLATEFFNVKGSKWRVIYSVNHDTNKFSVNVSDQYGHCVTPNGGTCSGGWENIQMHKTGQNYSKEFSSPGQFKVGVSDGENIGWQLYIEEYY